LIIGLMPVLFALLAVATDVTVLFTARRALAATADAAAVAGAQSADLAALYSGRTLTSLPLDCGKARMVIHDRFDRIPAAARTGPIRVQSITCNGTSVSVTLRSSARMPFASHFGVEPEVTVSAAAAARSPLR
jgi:uncharacterized membrane protein